MDENTATNLWNKNVNDLTVKDTVVLSVAPLAIMVGGIAVLTVAVTVKDKATSKFRSVRASRQLKKTEES